jgi:hypothetical protein
MLRGALLFGLCAMAFAITAGIETRSLPNGENPWLKPLRFALAFFVHALTLSWLWRLTGRDALRDRLFKFACRGQLWVMGIELGCIVIQSARAVPSHFNTATAFDSAIFTIMGLGTIGLFAGLGAMAVGLIRRPGPSLLIDASVLAALVLCIGGGLVGVIMVTVFGGHSVGPGDGELPLFGWRLTGGDLRVPHFIGIHALQALPLIGWALQRWNLTARTQWAALGAGTAAYATGLGATLVLTLSGKSVLGPVT